MLSVGRASNLFEVEEDGKGQGELSKRIELREVWGCEENAKGWVFILILILEFKGGMILVKRNGQAAHLEHAKL